MKSVIIKSSTVCFVHPLFNYLRTCEQHIPDCIFSLRGEIWAHQANLTMPLLIEVPVPSQEGVMVFDTIFNNISVISWQSVLLVEETGGPGENHRPVKSLTNLF